MQLGAAASVHSSQAPLQTASAAAVPAIALPLGPSDQSPGGRSSPVAGASGRQLASIRGPRASASTVAASLQLCCRPGRAGIASPGGAVHVSAVSTGAQLGVLGAPVPLSGRAPPAGPLFLADPVRYGRFRGPNPRFGSPPELLSARGRGQLGPRPSRGVTRGKRRRFRARKGKLAREHTTTCAHAGRHICGRCALKGRRSARPGQLCMGHAWAWGLQQGGRPHRTCWHWAAVRCRHVPLHTGASCYMAEGLPWAMEPTFQSVL